MAYITKTANGYRAQVERNGVRDSATRDTKAAASAWAVEREAEIMALKRGGFPNKTLAQALERYRDEISPAKGGGHWEVKRINAFLRDFKKLAAKPLTEIDTTDFSTWRDKRLQTITNRKRPVSKGSVQRDLNLLSHVMTIARTEWKWMGESPLVGLRAPGQNPPRTRIVHWREVRCIVRWLGHKTGVVPATKQAQAALAYLLALRTAMRAGEVLQLGAPGVIDAASRKATVHHKTEHRTGAPRVVPLSKRALRLMGHIPLGGFTISSASLDATFRKATHSLLIKGTTFHDSRASALTRMVKDHGPRKGVDVQTLAKISGHRDLNLLLNTYFRVSSAEIAARLD